jgi:hypothetical protein
MAGKSDALEMFRKGRMFGRSIGTLLLILFQIGANAQQFAREISQFVGGNARPFLQPVVDAVHANIHAGLFVPAAADGLHIGVEVVAMGIVIPDDRKTFTPQPYNKTVEFTRNGVTYLGDLDIAPSELPTAAGLKKKYTFTGRLKRIRPKGLPYVPNPIYDSIQQDASVSVGGYQDLSTIIFGTPQLTIGSLYGTEVMVRFLPAIRVEDIGEVNSFGIGIRHLISRYVESPVDVAGSIMYQTFTLHASDEGYNAGLDLSSVSAQLFASKNLPLGIVVLTPYAGAGWESGSVDVRYDFADPYIGKQNLTFTSGSRLRFVSGVRAKVWKLVAGVEYNVALLNGFAATVGFAW